MRITGGSARGRRLLTPRSPLVRPTPDLVRKAIFDILGGELTQEHVLDLYAGTGALGLEAASRGAAGVVLVDCLPEAVRLCRENARALGFADRVRVLAIRVEEGVRRLAREGWAADLVLAAPPYDDEGAGARLLALLGRWPLLAAGATLVLQHHRGTPPPAGPPGLESRHERCYGMTAVTFFDCGLGIDDRGLGVGQKDTKGV